MRLPEIAAAPDWLIELCSQRHTERADAAPLVELDSEEAVKRARHYLEHDAPEAAEGERNITAFRVAAMVKDFGVSEHENLSLLAELWNGEKCAPPLDYEEMQKTVESAYKTGFLSPGSKSPDHDFADVPTADPEPIDKAKRRLYFELPGAMQAPHDAPYLIKGMLDQGASSVVFGDSNVGKSFVMLDVAFHIAAGRQWRDHRVRQSGVVYVAAEGGRTIRSRVLALKKHFQVDSFPLALVPCGVDLGVRSADTRELIELIGEAATAMGCPVGLVVVDTLSRALAGGDESSSTDMGALVKNMDRLREYTAAHVSFVHHSGKDASRGARGWSGLRAAIDTEIEIVPGEIRVTKQRDMEAIKPLGFSLESVPLGEDGDGDQITSCVVLPASRSADKDFEGIAATLTKAQGIGLRQLQDLSGQEKMKNGLGPFDDEPDVALVAFRTACFGKLSNGNRDRENRQFLKVTARLSELGLIEINEDTVRLAK